MYLSKDGYEKKALSFVFNKVSYISCPASFSQATNEEFMGVVKYP